MEDFDDDFGELYAGVEGQAKSAVDGGPDFSHFYTEEDVNGNIDKAENANRGSEERFVSNFRKPETNEGYCSGSDSEDDLKIVLNDEDCKGQMLPVAVAGRGSMKNDDDEDDDGGFSATTKEYTNVRTQGAACTSNGKASEAVALASSVLVRGGENDYNNSMRNQRNGSSSHITSCIREAPNPMVVGHNRYGFSLPWYRTILDVNIESFEEKPWRYPGVDITDYFNFGLNENSWKLYCNSLEQLWLTSMKFGIPVSDIPKFYQAKEAGSEFQKFGQETISKELNHAGPRKHARPSSRISDSGIRIPLGRAIQIEDSIGERQPSFDSRQPRSLDSDVVIQISVQDLSEETSSSGEERGCPNGSAHDTSENGEVDGNGNQIIPAKEDDLLLGTPGGNVRSDRYCQEITTSHPIRIDSDDYGNNLVVDLEGYDHPQVTAISLETFKIANKTKESVGRNTLYADQAQLSLGDDNQLSPSSSCFESDSEASKNSVHFDHEDIHTPLRSSVSPSTELCASTFKNSKGNGVKRKLVDIKDYSRSKSSDRKEAKHRHRKLNSVVEPKIQRKDDNDVSPTSETEDLYDRDSMLNSCRRKERLRDFCSNDREDISNYKESSHYGIRCAENHVNRKFSHKFQDKRDPYDRKTWNEREYFFEDRDTDWNRPGRTQFTKERSPLPSRERRWHSRYSSHTVEERDARSRRYGDQLQFKKIPNHNGGCIDYKHEYGFVGEKIGRCVSFPDRKRNTLYEFDKRKFPQVRRELRRSGGGGGNIDSVEWDSCGGQAEDEYCRNGENQCLHHQSSELYTADKGMWNDSLAPRYDVSHSRTDERYWRHGRRIYSAEAEEGNWFDSRYDAHEIDDILHPIDHFKWRRSNWRSEVLHWTEEQLTLRHHGDRLYSEKASHSYKKYVRRENSHAKYGSSHDAVHIDGMLSEQHGLRMMRKGSSGNCINRNSKMYKGKHKQAVLRCRDSSDLVVGEGKVQLWEAKSSVRCYKGRTLVCNGRLENMDPAIGGERTTLVDSCESEKVRAVRINTPKVGCNHNNEKGLDEFPVIAQNEALDIEEGQVASNGDRVVEGYRRMLETKAKMEKRWERFKEPISLNKEPDKLSKPDIDLLVETAEEQQHRPARKRRWGIQQGKHSMSFSLIQ